MFTLISGNPFSIKDIFAEDRKIIIPDMQREYCWAQTKSEINNKSLVENFISDLIKQAPLGQKTQMGLLYAYESPQNHIQLCDGQQRITTLYILIGVLYRHLNILGTPGMTDIKDILISNFELTQDDKEPRLQYAIRESTLLFLRDLVYCYFLGEFDSINSKGAKYIKKEPWYFEDYDLDPTIQNILIAIDTIELLITENTVKKILLNYVTSDIEFLYFDMVNRKHGEEQFVVINTTGKPLTSTENFKPQFLGNLNDTNKTKKDKSGNDVTELRFYSDMWEEWEQYFWENKNANDLTADKGLNEFFRWVYIIEKSKEQISSEKENYSVAQKALANESFYLLEIATSKQDTLELVNEYFVALKSIKENSPFANIDSIIGNKISQIDCFKFLPILLFVKNIKIIDSENNHRNLRRAIQFFKSRSKNDSVQKASITTVIEAIKIISNLNENNKVDITDCLSLEDVSQIILTQGGKFKLNIYKKKEQTSQEERIKFENIFWEVEDLECCKGDISYVFEFMEIDINSDYHSIDYELFKKAKKVLKETFNKPTDIMRSALLTFGDYCKWDGYTYNLSGARYSFGEDANFFRVIIQNNSDDNKSKKSILIEFLKCLYQSENIQSKMAELIKNYKLSESSDNRIKIIDRLIKDEQFFGFSNNKLVAWNDDEKKGYVLKGSKVTNESTYKEIC